MAKSQHTESTGPQTQPKPKVRINLFALAMSIVFFFVAAEAWGADSLRFLQDGSRFAFAGIVAAFGIGLLLLSRRKGKS